MPVFDAAFFLSLGGVVLADLLLAGDNAVVIALAARNLPKELRRRAILLGAGAAVLLRTLLTVGAVYVLGQDDIPIVRLAGGLALFYIAWQLAIEEHDDHEGIDSAHTLKAAVRTILIADVVMSIDNVLAVGAFAKDEPWLVVFGLLISIPIVMGGAGLLLSTIDRFPILTWIGAALIAYVAGELVLQDPLVQDHLTGPLDHHWAQRLLAVGLALLVTLAAWYRRATDDDLPRASLDDRTV